MLILISEGFPEFSRCFNHSHLWKLQSVITAGCSAIELLRKTRPQSLKVAETFLASGRDAIFITDEGGWVKLRG